MIAMESDRISELQWVQPKAMQRSFELRSGDNLVASLSWLNWMTNHAAARTANHEWIFNRRGVFKSRVSIKDASTDTEIAHLTYGLQMQGDIVFADGRKFGWHRLNFWQTKWEMTDENGFPLYTLEITKELLNYRAIVHFAPEAQQADDLLLLVLIGWYLTYLIQQDSATAAGAV